MSARRPLSRTSITIPDDALQRADRLAERWARSRSWVLAEGVRRLEEGPVVAGEPQRAARLDPSRRRQLRDDLALSPLERVVAAERTAREVPARSCANLFVSFDRAEDYHAWKRLEAAGQA